MTTPLQIELAALPQLSVAQLVARYEQVFGDATASRNKSWLVKRIAWRLQAQVEGGLTERIHNRVRELADDTRLRLLPPREKKSSPATATQRTDDARLPMVGTVLKRPYKGRELLVTILADGFLFEAQRYDSLSAVAKAATGTHVNGFQFFRLTQERS